MMPMLKKCPFCGGKATLQSAPPRDNYFAKCRNCDASTLKYFRTPEEAVTAWNRRAQPENEPLTLDELKEMDGEPVYVVPINLHDWICDAMDGKPEWGMVRKSWVRIWRSETADLMHTDFDFEDYGKTWLAYRYKKRSRR